MSLPILCYHKVGPLQEEGRWLNVEPETLRSHIRYFRRRRFEFLQAWQLADVWRSRAVCLTFDDAYVSTLTYGVEVMASEGVSGSIYVVSSQMGGASVWDAGREGSLASIEQIVEAAQRGFEIGNHTASHPRLSKLSAEEQRVELSDCHQALSDLNIQANSIAFPYGAHNPETLAAMKALGYRVGLGLSRRPAVASDNRLALPRIVISYGDRLPMLLYKLHLKPRLPSSKRRSDYVA